MTNKKLTILHTEASKGWGGQEIRIFQESLKFAERGHKVLIACQEGSKISEKAKEAGFSVYIVRMEYPIAPLGVGRFFKIVKDEKVDIIHTHSSKDSWLAGIAGRISGTPVVRSRHLTTPVGQNCLTVFVYRHLCDIIITSGMHIRNTLITRNKLNPEKIVSIPAGVDTEKFNLNISGDKIRTELQLENSYPVVGTVAILRHWKGHRFLLDAVQRVAAVLPQVKFIIAGDGPQWNNLHEQIRSLGIERHVIMTGFRNDVPEIMSALDIFILPSVASEATSQVIPQALAVGKPVIATDAGGLSEIIEDGVTGLLIPPKDSGAIADAIIRMAKNKEEAEGMASRGRKKILEGYTFKKMIEDTEKVYYQVLKKRSGAN
ncbi:MAG: glycosyltransferase family 4 protein [Nitrospirae bacterium]|nr:glycosyltransferase family 4 protein [Nitrospirota bacterium]